MAGRSGVVTFLFTDIEGSTARWEADEEAMTAALEAHDDVLRSTIEAAGGVVFKHTGDGMCAAFSSPRAALDAAVDAQRALTLPVRMAIATGEAVERAGDYFGPVLNRTARLMAAGHGGQILVAGATANLVAGVDLVDLGSHQLRDLSEPVRVFQVRAEGLRAGFAPLRTLNASLGNLRPHPTSFIGRAEELEDVAAAVGAHPLVTLTGPGGVGKTRLAVQVAAEVAAGFADGVWLCELAAAANGAELRQVVAQALGVAPRPQMTLAESIVDFLRPRELLVVLDNCEHLVEEVAQLVEAISAGAPQVRVLATGREGLGVPGEHHWPLRSLSVPSAGADAMASDAVRLFVDRAAAVLPGFDLDDTNRAAVVEICRRLDGIPLAIELAAARVAAMSPSEIAGHLDERFRLLTGGPRTQVERHKTMRAAIGWSYSLVPGAERVVFDRLGVFPASFDEAAAVAVTTGEGTDRWGVIDALADLVAKSMVVAERLGGVTRYSLLESLRQFAREQYGETIDELRRRHAAHYAAFAEQAGAGLQTPDELTWRPRLVAELDNLRAATTWAFNAPHPSDVALGVNIITSLLGEMSIVMGSEMRAWAAPVMARTAELSSAQRAVAFAVAALDEWYAGHPDRATALARRALGEETSPEVWHFASYTLALGTATGGDPTAAMALLAQAQDLRTEELGDSWHECHYRLTGFWVAHSSGQREVARSLVEHGLAAARRAGSPSLLAIALSAHSRTVSDEDPDLALAEIDEALQLVAAGATTGAYSPSLQTVALLHERRGDLPAAARAISTAIDHEARNGALVPLSSTLPIAIIVLAADHRTLGPAATLSGALHGPVLGRFPAFFGGDHRERYEQAVAAAATALGSDAFANAQQQGAAMGLDDIVAFGRTQLSRLAEAPSSDPGASSAETTIPQHVR